MFDERTVHSELSDDNVHIDDVDNAEHHIVNEDEGMEDTEAGGVAIGDDDHVVQTTLESSDLLVNPQRQHSTTEYLPGMLHSNSPPGLLPKFPSWALLLLGDYASYNPSTGSSVVIVVG